jgi:hypothetical protein
MSYGVCTAAQIPSSFNVGTIAVCIVLPLAIAIWSTTLPKPA